uniref:Uncharacterized protein n=1 Tax=Cannabis sativa TaxID=3483 RepID=A0A803R1M4_CANSA
MIQNHKHPIKSRNHSIYIITIKNFEICSSTRKKICIYFIFYFIFIYVKNSYMYIYINIYI